MLILWEQGKCLMCVRLGCSAVGGVDGMWVRVCPGSGMLGWCSVCVSCEFGSLCKWQVQISVYCARWIPADLMCTQC